MNSIIFSCKYLKKCSTELGSYVCYSSIIISALDLLVLFFLIYHFYRFKDHKNVSSLPLIKLTLFFLLLLMVIFNWFYFTFQSFDILYVLQLLLRNSLTFFTSLHFILKLQKIKNSANPHSLPTSLIFSKLVLLLFGVINFICCLFILIEEKAFCLNEVIFLMNGSGFLGGIFLLVQLKLVTKEIGSEMNSVKYHQTQIITESVNMESINDTTRFFLEQNSCLILKKTEYTAKAICLIVIIIIAQFLAILFSSYTYIQANNLQIKQDYDRHPNEFLFGKKKVDGIEKNIGSKNGNGGKGDTIGDVEEKLVGLREEKEIEDLERARGKPGEIGERGVAREETSGKANKREKDRIRDEGVDSFRDNADQPLNYWKEEGGGCGFYPFGGQLNLSTEQQLLRGWSEQIIGFYIVILTLLLIKLKKKKRREEETRRVSFQVESMPFFKHLKIKNSGRMREEEDGKEDEKREENEK